jgi:WD40 repeat protein
VATGSRDGTVKIWDADTGKLEMTLPQDSIPVQAIAFSRDGRTLVSGNDLGTITFWHVPSGQELFHVTSVDDGSIRGIFFTDNGRRMVSQARVGTTSRGHIVFWETEPNSSENSAMSR